MSKLVWCLLAGLVVLHQIDWGWNAETLVAGFLPITLFYHACISVAAGVTWFLAVQFAWPDDNISGTETAEGQGTSA